MGSARRMQAIRRGSKGEKVRFEGSDERKREEAGMEGARGEKVREGQSTDGGVGRAKKR